MYINTYTQHNIHTYISSAPGTLTTLVTSVALYSLTRATMMSPWQDQTRVCGYTHMHILYTYIHMYIYIYVHIYIYIYILYICVYIIYN